MPGRAGTTMAQINALAPEFVERIMRLMMTGASTRGSHMLGQSLIKVNGDEAGADTYFIASSCRPAEEGGEVLNQMGGRYVDFLVREDGRWKVKRRVCVHDWSNTTWYHGDWLGKNAYVQGMRSREDPSLEVLGVEHSGSARLSEASARPPRFCADCGGALEEHHIEAEARLRLVVSAAGQSRTAARGCSSARSWRRESAYCYAGGAQCRRLRVAGRHRAALWNVARRSKKRLRARPSRRRVFVSIPGGACVCTPCRRCRK